ncbi:MAG: hypothetical protein KGH94_02190 [Candidatus Micrarchaeota archaeon]|nr:hypothetical protein [Candidatus Micrarchaeota archaeon]
MADRLLTINLRNYLVRQPVRRRHMRLARYVRNRIAHYVKVEEEKVKISKELNNLMVKSYSKSMLPLKVNVKIENGTATASPFTQKKEGAAAPAQQSRQGAAKTAPIQKAEKKAEAKAEAKPSTSAKK